VPQVTESLSKGVIDGAMVPWEGAPPIKLQESHQVSPRQRGRPAEDVELDLRDRDERGKYNSLPPDLKKVIDDNSGLELVEADRQVFDGTTEPGEKLAAARAACSTRCRRPSTTAG
jgi:hypothetical protein